MTAQPGRAFQALVTTVLSAIFETPGRPGREECVPKLEDRSNLDARTLSRSWHGVLGCLELELNPHNFSTWFKGTRALRFDGTCLVVEARSAMTCDWLNQRLRHIVERAAGQSFEGPISVQFVPPGTSLDDEHDAPGSALTPAPARGTIIGTVNCGFTFEDYQASDGNMLALRACTAIVEPVELQVSPVVLYGQPGMGKTHLLHALACRARDRGRRVACLNAEEFANRFLSALRGGRAEEFQAQMRAVDLLIIDDLQSMATKKATLDELVHTFEAVTNAGGHIVVASERNPFELGLPDRLESRLAAGLVVRVEPFAVGEQRAFIEAVARRKRIALPAWAIDRIAGCHAPSVRVLLGFVNGAMALQEAGKLDMAALDARLAGTVMIESAASVGRSSILGRIAKHFGLAVDDLCGRARTAQVAEARAVAVAALQAHGTSLNELSAVFGKRDKSTILSLGERGRRMFAEDESLRTSLTG